MRKPNFIVVLIDDLRFDEFGAGGHPYMETPHIDRLAKEGAVFERAFHTTPICSPNRASIMTGQYASRHGIIDNVARDAMSHRLPNYHLALQELGYETAHVGKWHMGNDGKPRPGYDRWVSFDGHGRLSDPKLNIDGSYEQRSGYITDLLNEEALAFLRKSREKPFSLFAHKVVPDAEQAADGTLSLIGYVPAERHRDLYKGRVFPKTPNMLSPAEVVKTKPAWSEAFELKKSEKSRALLAPIHAGSQEEIRLRAAMMASVDEGVGEILATLEKSGQLDNTVILLLGDNGYFFGEHGLGPERRFAYEAGIRSPFLLRYPPLVKPGSKKKELVITQDIAPTLLELAGTKPGAHIQGRSLIPLFKKRNPPWRKSILIEYWAEQALRGCRHIPARPCAPTVMGIRWLNRSRARKLDEL
jgi:N-acetylglucosamine-6-sulfatase